MDRVARLLGDIDWAACTSLEIGPLHRPILRRPEARVSYLDHADTASLRKKYVGDAAVDAAAIVDVDIVWTEGRLADAAGGRRFDHVIASHVIEHVPDPVWWLGEIAGVLAPHGTLRLMVPDKRYTFDFPRRETTVADLLEAWLLQRRRPGPRDIMDFWLGYRAVDITAAWRGEYPSAGLPDDAAIRAALDRARDSLENGRYHDVHVSVFTPASFAEAMQALAALGLLRFACCAMLPTAPDELEFAAHLMLCDDAATIAESWRWAGWVAAGRPQ